MTADTIDYEEIKRRHGVEPNAAHVQLLPLSLCLSAADWLKRDIPPPDFLSGEWLSTTSRTMVVAPTGLGKTNFMLGLGSSIASGTGFLHWAPTRLANVLFIDGEMSRRLVKVRIDDAVRRIGQIPKNLSVLCRDDIEEMPPLDTEKGQEFIDSVIEQAGAELVIFDNIQALIGGDMKEEDGWRNTLPWAKSLTKRSIGQVWVHHTGHDETHSYGTKTREWQLDAVMLLERLEGVAESDIAFRLNFTKARERAPHNRADFEPVTVRLESDQWQVEHTSTRKTGPKKKASPTAMKFHSALLDALAAAGQARTQSSGRISVTMDQWRAECHRLGLIDPKSPDNRQRASFSKYRLELLGADKVACNGDFGWSI
jgi:RecA-family ATPase